MDELLLVERVGSYLLCGVCVRVLIQNRRRIAVIGLVGEFEQAPYTKIERQTVSSVRGQGAVKYRAKRNGKGRGGGGKEAVCSGCRVGRVGVDVGCWGEKRKKAKKE